MDKEELTHKIQQYSSSIGFDLFGVTNPTNNLKNYSNLLSWLNNRYHASMHWIENRKDERRNIYNYFPEVKSVISLGINYHSSSSNRTNSKYKISNYAVGDDYHLVIKKKLYDIIAFIKKYNNEINYRVCVDTSPIMEKAWAQRAGLGWIGKHTNLINNEIGSWFFICEILLDIKLEYNKPFTQDLCGTCTKCIDACPTEALTEYVLDSNKCISYLTIEHRDKIDKIYNDKLDNWVYGCDICQDVCPWNIKFSKETSESQFLIREEIKNKSDHDWELLSLDNYRNTFSKSAVKRTKYEGLKRNILLNKNNNAKQKG